jgi:hypothetical protein
MAEHSGIPRAARYLYGITALAAVALNTVHIFIGGPRFLGRLFASNDLEPTAQWMGYFIWHIVSVLLAVIAVAFAYIAVKHDTAAPHLKPLAYFATAILLGVAVLGGALGLASDGALSSTPVPYAFGILGLLSVAGTAKLNV